MSQLYQPLHHKYRPESFDALVGQDAIAITLKQAILTNRIAPAYLFTGPRGTGKTSSARILARSLNCTANPKPTAIPCGTCELCQSISNASSLDVIEIDAASNTGVDNIRELIERSRFAPVQARWKVYVIDECHMLSTAAFNALLKTLEEPSPQVVFILATTDPQRVLPTIISRCQRFDFRRIPLRPLTKHLKMIADQEGISINEEAIDLIAKKAQGGLRDAESMLDQLSILNETIKPQSVSNLIGEVPEKQLLKLASELSKANPAILLENCRTILDNGKDPISVLQGLASILRDLVLFKAAPNRPELSSIAKENYKDLEIISDKISLDQLLRWQSHLKGTEIQIRQSAQPRLWLEIILLGMLAKQEEVNNKESPILTKKTNPISEDLIPKEKINTNKPQLESKNDSNSSNLEDMWQQILGNLELPSTKMLLSQQARLVKLTNEKAIIQVSQKWIGMVESRISLLEVAINQTVGKTIKLVIESQEVIQPDKNIIKNKSKVFSDDLDIDEKKINSEIKNNIVDDIKQKNKEKDQLEVNTIDNKAENLANFFNGEVLDLDIDN